MSEARELNNRADVRKGDVLRREYVKNDGPCVGATRDSETSATAVEYVAAFDEHWLDPSKPGLLLLLDRPVILPTAPYSVIAPPIGRETTNYPKVLQPMDEGGQMGWFQGVNRIPDEDIGALLRKGWRIIESKEG